MFLTATKTNLHKIIGIIGILLIVLWFSYNFNHGERIQFRDGLGWDGAAYADWAQRDSWEVLSSGNISQYYIGRLLPSIVIHNISKLFHYDINSTPRIIHAFYIYNSFLLLVVGLLLGLIGKHYKWKLPVYFLGFSALFFNYPVLKNFSYNPTLVDISAYTVGLLIFYCYIKDRFGSVLLVSFLGSFIWPTMLYGALPLIIFGRTQLPIGKPKWHAHLVALTAAIALLALAGYMYFFEGLRQSPGTTPPVAALLPLSVFLFALYIYFALRPLIDIQAYLRAVKVLQWHRLTGGIVIFLVVKTFTFYFSDRTPGPLTFTTYLALFTQASLASPLVNVVAHAMHYGPFYLIAAFLWKDITNVCKQEGFGLAVFVALFAFLSIGSESRQFINAWPVVAILVCEVINRRTRQADWFFTYSIVAMSLVLSRFWLTINVGPWTGDFQKFPDQMLYMYSGPWISHQMYGVFLAVTILSILGIASLLRFMSSDHSVRID